MKHLRIAVMGLFTFILFLPVFAQRRYYHDRRTDYDVKKYTLRLKVNPAKKFLSGSTTIGGINQFSGMDSVVLDFADGFHISKILDARSGTELGYRYSDNQLALQSSFLSSRRQSSVLVHYYVLRGNEERAREEFFSRFPDELQLYTRYYGPFAFSDDKIALVQSPYPGMEHSTKERLWLKHGENNFALQTKSPVISIDPVGLRWILNGPKSGDIWYFTDLDFVMDKFGPGLEFTKERKLFVKGNDATYISPARKLFPGAKFLRLRLDTSQDARWRKVKLAVREYAFRKKEQKPWQKIGADGRLPVNLQNVRALEYRLDFSALAGETLSVPKVILSYK